MVECNINLPVSFNGLVLHDPNLVIKQIEVATEKWYGSRKCDGIKIMDYAQQKK